jgi:hypothetical protein
MIIMSGRPSPALADVGGVTGPDCVRLWVHTLDPNTTPSANSLYGIMRQVRNNAPPYMRDEDPIDFMADSCHIDRALAAMIAKDEMQTSGILALPQPPSKAERTEPPECRYDFPEAARIYHGCKPRGTVVPAEPPKIVCRNRYRTGNNPNGQGEVYWGCEPRP